MSELKVLPHYGAVCGWAVLTYGANVPVTVQAGEEPVDVHCGIHHHVAHVLSWSVVL